MRKLWMLTAAGLRKAKGNAVSLAVMFFIAALLLNAGLLVSLNFGGFFDDLLEELHTPDAYFTMPDAEYRDEIASYLETSPSIAEYQLHKTLSVQAETGYKGEKRIYSFLFHDAGRTRKLADWNWIGEHTEDAQDTIYLPYVFGMDGGYRIGDRITFSFDTHTLAFTVGGFFEDGFFSSTDTGLLGLYLPAADFEALYAFLDDPAYRTTLFFTNYADDGSEVESEIRDLISSENSYNFASLTSSFFTLDRTLLTTSRTMMPLMISVMMVAFAAIIVAVCVIVVRFRIRNSIEDDMLKIGSLKAIGYTSNQIRLSVILQFVLIAVCGSILGIAASYPLTPVISNLFAQQSGLKWEQGFDPVISLVSLCSMLAVVLLVSLFSTRRIRTLSPIIALRGGIVTHSFRRNWMPLHKTRGSLPAVLAMKQVLQNLKQSVMIFLVVAAVSFAGAFGVLMLYNTTVDTTAFLEVPGVELSNVAAVFSPSEDPETMKQDVSRMESVEKAQYIDDIFVRADGKDISASLMEDFAQKKTDTVYKGRYPLHENEAAISGLYAESIGKTVGDTITLTWNDAELECLITGLSQGANMGGYNISILSDTMRKLNPDFTPGSLQIYLKNGTDAEAFIASLEAEFGERLINATNMDKAMQDGAGSYTSIVSKVGVVMFLVTIAVVLLVLYFVIHSSIIRKRRYIGTQKAIGFTTLQLMNQFSLSFLLPVLFGVAAGSVAGMWLMNPIMSVAQRMMGIMKASYLVKPSWTLIFAVLTVLTAYLTSLFITGRIRKISAYSLVTE